MRKRLLIWASIAVLVLPALVYASFMLISFYEERDQLYLGRLHRARSDISAMQTAVDAFHKEYGTYPARMDELVQSSEDNATRKQFLKEIPMNPWGTEYFYEIEHGDNVKIWTIPDKLTQAKAQVQELSNRTNWNWVLRK